jgi:hypothetical protein
MKGKSRVGRTEKRDKRSSANGAKNHQFDLFGSATNRAANILLAYLFPNGHGIGQFATSDSFNCWLGLDFSLCQTANKKHCNFFHSDYALF